MNILEVSYFFPNTIEEIDEFSGKDFEEFLFHFFTVIGLDPRMTNDSDDKGIDLMIKRTADSEKRVIGIQAKRWKGNVGPNEIRKMLDGKNHYNLEELRIITTSKLTSSAKTTALNNHITILDRDRVEEFLQELKKKDDLQFRNIKKRTVSIKMNDNNKDEHHTSNYLVSRLKSLRIELSNTHTNYTLSTWFIAIVQSMNSQ
jgi:restriction system protein